jgi:hypothetical protein|tara:strand:- start:1076 stop:1450 length:375 start_codon:yes stop_codon:yes gene_type:complete
MKGSTIAIILFILCVISIGVFLGVRMMNAKKRKEQFLNTPGLHFFKECNYGGKPSQMVEDLPKTEEDFGLMTGSLNFKSFILTKGYKMDTYNEPGEKGVKISYTGPKEVACLDTPINSAKFTKA